jgi:hypothetical protein
MQHSSGTKRNATHLSMVVGSAGTLASNQHGMASVTVGVQLLEHLTEVTKFEVHFSCLGSIRGVSKAFARTH